MKLSSIFKDFSDKNIKKSRLFAKLPALGDKNKSLFMSEDRII